MDFPIPPEFWWRTDILSSSIFLQGVDQEILPCRQGRIGSVKINPSLLMMREWQIQWLNLQLLNKKQTFFHHYQGSIDFNTVNIHRTVWVYFLIFPGSRDGILSEMFFKDHIIQYTPCSLGSVQGNTSLGSRDSIS